MFIKGAMFIPDSRVTDKMTTWKGCYAEYVKIG